MLKKGGIRMKKRVLLTASLAVIMAFVLAISGSALAAEHKAPGTLTGTIYCIDASGKMLPKAGVCPAEHIGHLIMTDDGRAIMLGGGEKMEQLIRNMVLPSGAKVRVRGEMAEEFRTISVEEIILSVGAAGGP